MFHVWWLISCIKQETRFMFSCFDPSNLFDAWVHETRFMTHSMHQTSLMHQTSFMHEMAGSALGPRAGRPAKAIKEILLEIIISCLMHQMSHLMSHQTSLICNYISDKSLIWCARFVTYVNYICFFDVWCVITYETSLMHPMDHETWNKKSFVVWCM